MWKGKENKFKKINKMKIEPLQPALHRVILEDHP